MSSSPQTSTRPRNLGGSFSSRRGHGAQLSISDTNHHVTEAIGDMYGDDDYGNGRRDSRPLSFVASPLSESVDVGSYFDGSSGLDPRNHPKRPHATTNGNSGPKSHTLPAMMPSQRSGFDTSPLSPTLSLRDHSPNDGANQQFPLNDIDYESTPAAVAQELHNLQALRRMSMDVGNPGDPDLPSFQGVSLMPSVAPTGGDDEDDPSRLFWVPARVHPELAPMEFKTFLENRVQTIKRRSGEQSSLSPEGLDRSGSGGGLRRKKSMLSRQIDNSGGRGAVGYKDGADQLERKKSLSHHLAPELNLSDLQELDELVRDPSKAMQKLSLDTSLRKDLGMEVPESEDKPILPAAPGIGLRRSTHTTYRRGSLRKGTRVGNSRRVGQRGADTEGEESPASSPIGGAPLTRVMSEPVTENFSRPNRTGRRAGNIQPISPVSANFPDSVSESDSKSIRSEPYGSHTSSGYPQRTASYPRSETPVPMIVETPPQPEDESNNHTGSNQTLQYPERMSSQTPPPIPQQSPARDEPQPPARSNKRPTIDRQASSSSQNIPKVTPAPAQTANDMAQRPSPLLANSSRTDTLTFIPTMQEEKKSEKKAKKEESENSGIRKPSWGWFKGSDDKDKREKKKEDDLKDAKKVKSKVVLDKTHDNTRLDVLQHSIDSAANRGRESLLLERESTDNRLQDERKKESTRKSSEGKKEKDGIFSSLFGGSKRKGDRDSGNKKASSLRAVSPEPPHRHQKPDIDYNWTRFSILEERAIYRMAHIKLANPRRALYSQVLLSNFMYSYLAKVQQMHPHVQIPQSAQQKKQQEAERRQKELEKQQALLEQQGGEQYRYDYHQVGAPS
jgi:hypothetical protein